MWEKQPHAFGVRSGVSEYGSSVRKKEKLRRTFFFSPLQMCIELLPHVRYLTKSDDPIVNKIKILSELHEDHI